MPFSKKLTLSDRLLSGARIHGTVTVGHFLIPLDPGELIDQLIDKHQWGRSETLEPCRLLRPPRPEEMAGALRVVRERQRASRQPASAPDDRAEDLPIPF